MKRSELKIQTNKINKIMMNIQTELENAKTVKDITLICIKYLNERKGSNKKIFNKIYSHGDRQYIRFRKCIDFINEHNDNKIIISDDEYKLIRLASLFHDIGKLRICDKERKKPNKDNKYKDHHIFSKIITDNILIIKGFNLIDRNYITRIIEYHGLKKKSKVPDDATIIEKIFMDIDRIDEKCGPIGICVILKSVQSNDENANDINYEKIENKINELFEIKNNLKEKFIYADVYEFYEHKLNLVKDLYYYILEKSKNECDI